MKIIFILLTLICGLAHASKPNKIVVVLDDEQKAQLIGVSSAINYLNSIDATFNVYSVDDVKHFENYLSEGLSPLEHIAKKQMFKKVEKIGKEKLGIKAREAYQAQFHILKYKLTKKPAIIIDDKYLIYGEFNVNRAINYYLDKE